VLQAPLLLELQRRQVAQRRVDAFDVVDIIEETPDLPMSVAEVVILGEIDLLFFERAVISYLSVQALF
jgi:hypothetical protein